MAPANINLIATKTDKSTELTSFSATLKKISYASVLALLIAALVAGGIFAYLEMRTNQLIQEKNALVQSVTGDSAKEGILLALKDRIAVIDKIATGEKHADKVFEEVAHIVPPENIESVSLDDNNKVLLATTVSTIEQTISVVDILIQEAQAKKLTKPALTSLRIDKDGKFSLSLSFVATL